MSPDAGMAPDSKVSRRTTGCDVCQDRCGYVGRGSGPNAARTRRIVCAVRRARGRPRPGRQGLHARRTPGHRRRRLPALPAQPYAHRRRGTARRARPVRRRARRSAPACCCCCSRTGCAAASAGRGGPPSSCCRPARVAQFAYRHSLIGVVISLALLAPLLRHRSEFAALPDPRSRWRALANFVLMGAGSLVLGLVIVSVHANRMVGDPSLADRITHVLYGLFGFEGPRRLHGPHLLDGRLLARRARPADRGHHDLPRLPPRTPGRTPHPGRRDPAARPPGQARRPRLARPLRAPPRQGRRLLAQRQGGRDVPRRVAA